MADAALTLVECFSRMDRLPVTPAILPKLLEAFSDPDLEIDRVAGLFSHEPALTAKLLRLCNSAVHGWSVPATDVPVAITRLGLQTVYSLVVAACSAAVFDSYRAESDFDLRTLWTHSVLTAVAAHHLARDLEDDPGATFTASLLHDFGRLVLLTAFKAGYARLAAPLLSHPAALLKIEEESYAVDHAEIGGLLLEHWKFPAAICAPVRYHHRPDRAGDYVRRAALLSLADWIAHHVKIENSALVEEELPAEQEALQILNLTPEIRQQYVLATAQETELIETLCRATN